jgi:hypothetical protein
MKPVCPYSVKCEEDRPCKLSITKREKVACPFVEKAIIKTTAEG